MDFNNEWFEILLVIIINYSYKFRICFAACQNVFLGLQKRDLLCSRLELLIKLLFEPS